MRKTVLSLLLIFVFHQIFSQVVNEPANWPNTSWALSGTYEPLSLLGDPTMQSNFGFDDADAGPGSINNVAAESPIKDLTAAPMAGENFVIVNSTYVFEYGLVDDSLAIQYWDADAGTWNTWGTPIQESTAGSTGFDFCDGPFVAFSSDFLDISGFSATQLSGFRYRIVYDDGGDLAFGFCMNSPTLSSSSVGPPPCMEVSNISVTNITSSGASIGWDLGNTETAWEIAVQLQGTGEPTTNGQAVTTTPSFDVTGLNADTAYEVYVRANCLADGFSAWVGPINFATLRTPPAEPVGVNCTTGTPSVIFTEDFGLVEEVPPLGWTGTGFDGDINNGGNWSITIQNTNTPGTGPRTTWDGNPGVHLEYETEGNATAIASAITPAIDLTGAQDGAELSFYMHAYGSAIGTLNIGASTSPTGPFTNAFSWDGELQTSDNQAWVPVGVNLDAYLGQIIYLEFSYGGNGTGSTGDISIDTIQVESCGNLCVPPSDVVFSNLMPTSVDVAWTSNGTESNWEYVVQLAGSGQPTGNGVPTTVTNASVTGLTPSTAYEVYVRANCLADGFSLWHGPIPFSTLQTPPPPPVGVTCSGGASTDIFTEGFGLTENQAPMGWTGTGFMGNVINGNWRITNANENSIGTGPFNSWDSNPGVHLEYEGSGNSTNIASAITPAIDLTGAAEGAELSFFLHAFGSSIGQLNVGVSLSQTGPFNTIFTWNGQLQSADTDAWVPVGINIDGAIGQTFYIEFSYGGTGIDGNADIAIDQIKVESCIVTCAAPSDLTASNVTTNSVDLSWTPNAGESNWEYAVQLAGTGIPTGNGTASTTTTVAVNALNAATAYEVYVRANCLADGFSEWIGPVNFTTLNNMPPPPPVGVSCTTGTATTAFEENFGLTQNVDPSGWTGTGFNGNSVNGNWRITNPGTNTPDTGPLNSWDNNPGVHLEYEASGSATNRASAITPAIDLSTAVDGAELSFYMHAFGSGIGVLDIGVSTSASGPFNTEYSWAGEFQTAEADAWVPVGVNLDAYIGQTIFIEFAYSGNGTASTGDIAIDTIRLESCGNFCLAPTNLAASNVTSDGATISWTPGGTETNWEYVVQPVGTGLPTGAGTAATATSVAVTGLDSSTAYEVYVRANCLADGFSNWVGPITFTTLKIPPPPPVGVDCSAGGTAEIVFEETFGTTENTPPAGWTGTGFNGHITSGNWRITNANDNSPNTGPLNTWDGNPGVHLEYEASGNQTNIASAITPVIDLSSNVNSAELSFFMHAFGAATGTLNIGVSTSATGPFTNVFTWDGELQGSDADAWAPVGVNFDAFLGQLIYVEFAYGGNGSNITGDLALDQIVLSACSGTTTCAPPTALTVTNITNTSAEISWTPNNGETEWEYAVVLSGTPPPTSGTTVTNTSVTVTGLTPNTDYDFYVLANCSATLESPWAGPAPFSTLDPTGCNEPSSIIITNITDTSAEFSWTPNSGETEWEYAVVLRGMPPPASGITVTNTSVTVTGLMPNTDYDFYVLANCSATSESPWAGPAPFTTSGPPGCNEPSSIIVTNITDTSAEISWTPNNGETEWEYAVVLSGMPPPASGITVTNTSVTVTGLMPNTDYDFYVLANCSATSESPWAGPAPFTTSSPPVCDAPTAITVTNITATSAEISWTPNNGETEWEYAVVLRGTPPPASGTTVNVPNVTIATLTPLTDYDVYVLANCSATLESPWAGPIPFRTLDIVCTIPSAGAVSDLITCDDSSGDGIEAFNLGSQTAAILGTQDPSIIIVTYHDSLLDAQNGINPLTQIFIAANNTEIFVRVEDTTIPGGGCANANTKFSLIIDGVIPDVSNPDDLRACDDNSGDGFEFFDIESNTLPILGTLNPSDYSVVYYASEVDAETQTNPLTSPYENVSNPQTIYARVNRLGALNCYVTVDFDLIVNDAPITTFEQIDFEICAETGSSISLNAIAGNYTPDQVTIQWFFNGNIIPNGNALELSNVIEAGTYTINVTFNGTRCSSEVDIDVTESESCKIPAGISPGGDGFNDNFDLSGFDVENLEIYNRNGRLVYSKRDYTNEWEGQSNDGNELPVGTYFYVIEFKEGQVKSAWVYINK